MKHSADARSFWPSAVAYGSLRRYATAYRLTGGTVSLGQANRAAPPEPSFDLDLLFVQTIKATTGSSEVRHVVAGCRCRQSAAP